jgi:CheY-like chemotaxis protein
MVVEDRVINMTVMKSLFEEFGLVKNTSFHSNGSDALEYLKEKIE